MDVAYILILYSMSDCFYARSLCFYKYFVINMLEACVFMNILLLIL